MSDGNHSGAEREGFDQEPGSGPLICRLEPRKPLRMAILSLAFSPEREFLVSGGADRIIRVWDTTSHREIDTSKRCPYSVLDLAVTPRAEIIVAAVAPRTKANRTPDDVFGVVIPRDEDRCDSAWRWDRLQGEPEKIEWTTDFREMRLHPSNTSVAFSCLTGTRLQNLEDGEYISKLPDDEITKFAFMPDGRWITGEYAGDAGDAGREAVRLRDASSGEVIADIGHHDSVVTVLAVAPDGQRVASADRDGTICIWRAKTRKRVATFHHPDVPVRQLMFLPDGERLVSVDADSAVRLWEPGANDAVRTWEPPPAAASRVTSMALSTDGQFAATGGSKGKIRLWDLNRCLSIA
jgi:WD40 repeat protein